MKFLVTGGAGYIGSHMARRLIARGHEVVVLDSLATGHRAAIPEEARFVEADLRDGASVHEILQEGVEAVLHFAALALVAESVVKPELYWRVNVGGTLNLLDAMRAAGVTRLVFSSTCATYGMPDCVPMDEETPTRPVNPYGSSKLAVDRMISDHCAAHDLGAVSLRYFNVAGCSGELGEDHEPETHLIPNLLRAATGRIPHFELYGTDYPTRDGSAVRDYIHVEDLVDAHELAFEHVAPGRHDIFNLGNGSGFSVREVLATAQEVVGREIPVVESPRRPGDPPELVASSARAGREMGWAPARPEVRRMVQDAWAWMQTHPEGYRTV